MSAEVFVDTNVLVYNRDATEKGKQPAAAAWLRHLWETERGGLSVQVLQEFYVTVTCKLQPGMPVAEAQDEVRDYASWAPLPVTAELLEHAFDVESRHELQWWDALIVAGARMLGCATLLTEDLQDGMDFDGLLVVNPFVHEPPG